MNINELTKFTEECLFDYWVENYSDQYTCLECEKEYKKWFDDLSWSEINEIISHYTKEDEE